MPDTSAAREAIQACREQHRNVMSGMSMAELKLDAAGGLLELEPGEALPYPEDSPVWIEHALHGLNEAIDACDALRAALVTAKDETAKLETRDAC